MAEADFESFNRLSKEEFSAFWLKHFGKSIQVPSRRELHIRCLAYRIQEKTHGALSTSTRKRLRYLVGEIDTNPTGDLREAASIKPGVRLIREWRGKTHKVTVTTKDFVYRDKHYKSLSEIARLITGTRWSGPRFFGLNTPSQELDRAS